MLGRRRQVPGQSRPDGFHLERIPVHELDAEAGEQPTAVLVHDGDLTPLDVELARVQTELASLRTSISVLGRQLDTANLELAARGAVIRDRESRLRVARQKLAELNAPRSVLDTLTPPTWHDEHPVPDRPERR